MAIHSIIAWGLLLGLGVVAVVYAADARSPAALLGTAAVVNLLLAGVGLNERRTLVAAGAAKSRVESVTARYMGLIWLWGAACLIAVYTLVLSWREWPHFSAGFAAVGLLCIGFSWMLGKDADRGHDDETLLTIGRYLGIGQLVGMVLTMIGLAIDPDKEFIYTHDADWAGNGIFLFGALALAIVSAQALVDGKKNSS